MSTLRVNTISSGTDEKINVLAMPTVGYYTRQIVTQVDTTNRTSGTSWTLGPTFASISCAANSLIKFSYHIPMRNDAGGWGGMYIEPQVSFNGGTWQSLGSSGYENMTSSSADISSYDNQILVTPGITSAFTAQFRIYFRSYEGTVGLNNALAHEINTVSGTATIMSGDNGNQHYLHAVVEEMARFD